MATRAQYRAGLRSKLLALEDGGYGDFDYEDTDLNFHLSMAVARLFPAVYKRVTQPNLPLVAYGTMSLQSITPLFPERVFLLEDPIERQPVLGWRISGPDIVNIDPFQGATATITAVNAYYYDAYVLNDTDTDDVGIPATFEPLINLGALIEALESRQDTGVRGDPPPTGQFQEVQLIDRLASRFEKLKMDLAMALPGRMF